MKLSVLVVAYNQERYIRQCLDGIVGQRTNFEYEVVIGEDYSTDTTRTICEEYARKYSNVRLLSSDSGNLGYESNWSRTLKECRGEYIATCEGDDYWTDMSKLQFQVDYMEAHPECGLCYTDCDIVYDDENRVETAIFRQGLAVLDSKNPMRGYGYKGNVSWVIRREVVPFVEIPKDCTDVPLIIMYEAFRHFKFGYIDRVTSIFRKHSGSYSNDAANVKKTYHYMRNVFMIYDKYAPLLPDSEDNVARIYYMAITKLCTLALEFGDTELLQKIQSYYADLSHIKALVENLEAENARLRQELVDVRKSKRYRLGSLILHPIDTLQKR